MSSFNASAGDQVRFLQQSGDHSHNYGSVNVSDNARAVLGNVYNVQTSKSSEQAFLDEIKYAEMFSRYESIDEAYPETFAWVMDASFMPKDSATGRNWLRWDSFVDWLANGSDPYWISGKLGSGKSTLVKYIVEGLQDGENSSESGQQFHVVSHFFWAAGSDLQKSLLGCVRSLLWQVLDYAMQSQQKCSLPRRSPTSLTGMRKLLLSSLQSMNTDCVIILDGLDECSDTHGLLHFIEELRALNYFKVCLASRAEEAFQQSLSDCPQLRLQDLNHDDIELVVQQELLESRKVQRLKGWSSDVAKELRKAIIDKAEGVFLWVKLVVRELVRGLTNRDSLSQLRKRLEKLPADIYDLYSELLSRHQKDIGDYSRDTGFYLWLVNQEDDLVLALPDFHLATNESARRRWFDFGRYPCHTLADLRCDLDRELISTHVNVYSGGLLEVKHDDCLLWCSPYDKQLPSNCWIDAANYSISYVHRSAYVYITEMPKGQEILQMDDSRLREVTNATIETWFIKQWLLPPLANFKNYDFRANYESLKAMSFRFEPGWDVMDILQQAYDNMLRLGVIRARPFLSHDWPDANLVGLREAPLFLTPDGEHVDVCRLVAFYGCDNGVQLLRYKYNIVHVAGYTTNITLLAFLVQIQYDLINDSSLIDKLSEVLTAGKEPEQVRIDRSGEQMRWLALLGYKICHRNENVIAKAFDLMEQHNIDMDEVPTISMTSLLLREFPSEDIRYSIIATIPLNSLRSWVTLQDNRTHSSNGQVLFFCEMSRYRYMMGQSYKYRCTHPDDSGPLLEIMRQSASTRFLIFDNYLSLRFNYREPALMAAVQPFLDRSILCNSFIDAMFKIGKSRDEIECFLTDLIHVARSADMLKRFVPNIIGLVGVDGKGLEPFRGKFPELELLWMEADKVRKEIKIETSQRHEAADV